MLVETPTNPLMRITDLRAAADAAHRAGAILIVDNTFATPYFQRPLEFGADVVFHSTTKYLNGHSDMIGGIVVLNDDELAERIQFIQNAAGAVPGPHGLLARAARHQDAAPAHAAHDENGRKVAAWLAARLGPSA